MSPVQTAIREKLGERVALTRPYAAADFFLAPTKDVLREIVVDWQLPADMEQERR